MTRLSSLVAHRGATGRTLWRLAALAAALAAGPAALGAQITVDASSHDSANATTLSWPHTVGSGSNRFLVVGVSIRNANSHVTSLTYGGTALTFLGAQNNDDNSVRTEIWYRAAPASGTGTVLVTLNSGGKMVGGAVSFFGVLASSPQNPFVTANSTGTGTNDPSVTITSATGEMIVSATSTEGSAGTVTPTSQTQRWNNFYGNSGGDAAGFGGTAAGAASVTLGWHKTGTAKWAIIAVALQPASTTTLGNGTDPANANLAPGGPATMADAFTFQTSSGTDAVTAVTVTLATGTSGGLSLVEITNDAGTTVYGSVANPASDTPVITLTTNITATTTLTQYKIRVTPKSHANMPPPPGSTYTVTARITAWTGTNPQAGSDAAGTTVTIDNQSPGNVTSSTASAGDASVVLSWTNPGDGDLGSIVVLRATSAVSNTPAEGAIYVVGNTIGSATVACVVAAPTATCTDNGLTNGTAYYYEIFAKDASGNYATGAVPAGSPATPGKQTMSSAANQSFLVGDPSTTASAITVLDGTGKFKPGNDVYFVIPAGLSMTWDPAVASVTITGSAASKVSTTPTYTSTTCVRITVLSNFTAGDQIIVSGLAFKSFTAAGGPANLTLGLTACNSTVATDDKTKTIAAGAPSLTLNESVTPSGTQPPGTALAYTTTFTNAGTASAQSVVITDPIPVNTDFKVGSETHSLGTTGLTVAIAYSSDGGSTWAYTPVSGGGGAPAGYDRLVTHVRWTFTGNLSKTAPNNTGSTGITMRVR